MLCGWVTVGCASAIAYDVPAQASIGRSLGMSPKAMTSSASTPRSAASRASVEALVTSAALISSIVEVEDQVMVIEVADGRLGRVPVVLRPELLVPGQQLQGRAR